VNGGRSSNFEGVREGWEEFRSFVGAGWVDGNFDGGGGRREGNFVVSCLVLTEFCVNIE